MDRNRLADFLLRAGSAFAFLFPAIDGFANPESWIGYFPDFVKGYIPNTTLLTAFGIIEIVIALWILFGKNVFRPAILASAILVAIVAFNTGNIEVLFRDISILAMTASLAVMYAPKKYGR